MDAASSVSSGVPHLAPLDVREAFAFLVAPGNRYDSLRVTAGRRLFLSVPWARGSGCRPHGTIPFPDGRGAVPVRDAADGVVPLTGGVGAVVRTESGRCARQTGPHPDLHGWVRKAVAKLEATAHT